MLPAPCAEQLALEETTLAGAFKAAGYATFFALLSFYSVHTPLLAREDLRIKYEAKAAARPAPEPKFGREREREVRLVQDRAIYAGMVEAMDAAVGRVVV